MLKTSAAKNFPICRVALELYDFLILSLVIVGEMIVCLSAILPCSWL